MSCIERSVIRAPIMTENRSRLRSRRLREAIEQQPEIKTLQKLLLSLGGNQLVAPSGLDAAVTPLISAGFVMVGPVSLRNHGRRQLSQECG